VDSAVSDVHDLIQEEVISGSEYDTLIAIITKLDVLLKECSGRDLVSASQMTDQLLDIRQFVVKQKDKTS
jgi:hypothetical protein